MTEIGRPLARSQVEERTRIRRLGAGMVATAPRRLRRGFH
jgi:hypothetical protein